LGGSGTGWSPSKVEGLGQLGASCRQAPRRLSWSHGPLQSIDDRRSSALSVQRSLSIVGSWSGIAGGASILRSSFDDLAARPKSLADILSWGSNLLQSLTSLPCRARPSEEGCTTPSMEFYVPSASSDRGVHLPRGLPRPGTFRLQVFATS